MDVLLLKDYIGEQGCIPEGSVLQDVTTSWGQHTGLWCSMLGSVVVIVPITYCKELK